MHYGVIGYCENGSIKVEMFLEEKVGKYPLPV